MFYSILQTRAGASIKLEFCLKQLLSLFTALNQPN